MTVQVIFDRGNQLPHISKTAATDTFGGLPWLWPQRVPLLFVVIVIGSVGSHMPKRLRHYSLIERRYINPNDDPPPGR